MKETHRALETKEKFKKAFFTLYENRKIETITIKEVTDLAGFNRGTFYLYYKSIYDLLQKTEQEILDDFKISIDRHVSIFFDVDQKETSVEEFKENYFRYADYIKVLNGENGDPRFTQRMKNIIKETFRKYLKIEDIRRVSKFEYLLEYLVEANMSIIQYWLCNADKDQPRITLKDVTEIITYVAEHGFTKALTHYQDQ